MGDEELNEYAKLSMSDREAFVKEAEYRIEHCENIIALKKDPKFKKFLKFYIDDFQKRELNRAHIVSESKQMGYMRHLSARSILNATLDGAEDNLAMEKENLRLLKEAEKEAKSGDDSEEY